MNHKPLMATLFGLSLTTVSRGVSSAWPEMDDTLYPTFIAGAGVVFTILGLFLLLRRYL